MPTIFDAMGVPANNQPPPGAQTPVTGLLLPAFERYAQLLIQLHGDKADRDTIRLAWEMANDVFNLIGFRYKAPLAWEVIQPNEDQQEEDLPI